MMGKFYFCKTIGDGSDESPFSPAICKYTDYFIGVDARSDPTKSGIMMVECKHITDEQHELAVADPLITYFDVENVGMDDKISRISNRENLKYSLSLHGISIAGLTSNNTLRQVLQHVVKESIKRQNPAAINIVTHYDN